MIVEFIGSTGAGKTSLIAEVQQNLAKRAQVATSFDLFAESLGLTSVTNVSIQHLIEELVGFPYFLRSLGQHKEFVIFISKMLARQANFSIFTINNLRSLERKIGVYEIIKRREGNRIILVDEGTVHTAHNVFVYSNAVYTPEEITKFTGFVPLPDVIVYVKAPVEVLVQRTLQRSDPPRELKSKDRVLIEKYVRRADAMFDQLVRAENILNRLLIVDYYDFGDQGYGNTVKEVIDFIIDRNDSRKREQNPHPGLGKFAKVRID